MRKVHTLGGMDIALHKLRHVVAVAREGSFIAAADALPLSQSALTRSIQSLEREVGFSIFERGHSGTVMTPQGGELIRLAEDLLERSEHVAHELRALKKGARTESIRMGMGSLSAAIFLPTILPKLLERFPRMQVSSDSNSKLNVMLRRNELDFYIGGIPTGSDNFATANRFVAREIKGGALDNLALLVRQGHPLLELEGSTDDLQGYPVAAGGFTTDAWTEPELERLGLNTPDVVADDYSLLTGLARKFNYVLIASESLAVLRPDLELMVLRSFGKGQFLNLRLVLMTRHKEQMTSSAKEAAEAAATYLEELLA